MALPPRPSKVPKTRYPASGSLSALTILFVVFFDDFPDQPSQEHNHQSVAFLQLVHQFRVVSSASNSASLGRCHPVGQALGAFVQRYNFHHILSSQLVGL
jgi:hypothetical protein